MVIQTSTRNRFNELGLNDALHVRDICFNIIGRINSDLLILTDNGETDF